MSHKNLGDFVVIKKGQTMLLDTDTPVLSMLLIKGGHLIFDRKDVHLQAERILITEGGSFQVSNDFFFSLEPWVNNCKFKAS